MSEPQAAKTVFAPRLIPSIVALAMLGVLVSLGTWQVRRFAESSAHVAEYHQQHDVRVAVTSLSEAATAPNRLRELHFRRAALRGRLDLAHVQLLTARYKFGQRGWGVLAPLEVAAGPHARLLVHLGWVPTDKLDTYLARLAQEPPDLFRGRLRVVADVPPDQQPSSRHQDRPVWMVADPKAVARQVQDLDPDLLLDVGEQAMGNEVDPNKLPLDGYEYPVHPLPTKHIEYATTWYLFAVTLVAVWIALSRRKQSVDSAPVGP